MARFGLLCAFPEGWDVVRIADGEAEVKVLDQIEAAYAAFALDDSARSALVAAGRAQLAGWRAAGVVVHATRSSGSGAAESPVSLLDATIALTAVTPGTAPPTGEPLPLVFDIEEAVGSVLRRRSVTRLPGVDDEIGIFSAQAFVVRSPEGHPPVAATVTVTTSDPARENEACDIAELLARALRLVPWPPNPAGASPTAEGAWPPEPRSRAAAVASWGLGSGAEGRAHDVSDLLAADPDERVRVAALGALVRRRPPGLLAAWRRAMGDPAAPVRARACELAPATLDPRSGAAGPEVSGVPADAHILLGALADAEPTVAECAAFALGELGENAVAAGAVTALAAASGTHRDPLVREASVAALGSLGDPAGLAAVLAACTDKATIRRRAVLALAAFDGPEVTAAIEAALTDRDWQVRQAAEDLTGAGR